MKQGYMTMYELMKAHVRNDYGTGWCLAVNLAGVYEYSSTLLRGVQRACSIPGDVETPDGDQPDYAFLPMDADALAKALSMLDELDALEFVTVWEDGEYRDAKHVLANMREG